MCAGWGIYPDLSVPGGAEIFPQFSISRNSIQPVHCFSPLIVRAFWIFKRLELDGFYETNQIFLEFISKRLDYSEIIPVDKDAYCSEFFTKTVMTVSFPVCCLR